MRDVLKKAVLASLGTAVVSTSKISETLQALVHQGKMTAEEAERLTKELCQAGEDEMQDLRTRASDLVDKLIQNLNLAHAQDVSSLQARVENVEKRLNLLEDHLPKAPVQADPVPSQDDTSL